jgi:RHS repeat-associated protein
VGAGSVNFAFDTFGQRAWTLGGAGLGGSSDYYVYNGINRTAAIEQNTRFPNGVVKMSFLYDGVDHPLRLSSYKVEQFPTPPPPALPVVTRYEAKPSTIGYYELDLAGNVRRLRAPDGGDLGGYRYSAFGRTLESTVVNDTITPGLTVDAQPLRWKGMWRYQVAGTELYDARARLWSPALGSFLSVDEFVFHDRNSTLWGWPNQNPIRYSDPSGRCGPACIAAAVAIAIAYGSILASDDAATQRAAHPEAENSPTMQLALSLGMIVPLSAIGEVGAARGAAGLAPAAPAAKVLADRADKCGGAGASSNLGSMTLAQLRGQLSGAPRNALDAFFKSGGKDVGPDLTNDALLTYREIANRALNDPAKASELASSVQSDRVRLIDELLKQRGGQ